MSTKAMSEYVRITKYARYLPEKKRRETWKEQVNRVFDMHEKKFAYCIDELKPYLDEAKEAMLQKEVLGSQRALQFGGEAILNKETKIFNCTASHCNRPRFFGQSLFLLLCGCGVGFSVQKHHVAKLPKIKQRSNEVVNYLVEDSIEGWADALTALMMSFFDYSPVDKFAQYTNKTIKFDYSAIRPAGDIIKSSGHKAPGPDGLSNSLGKIEELIQKRIETGFDDLRPIDAYDIVMHTSDSVLSGGVRRSACICFFSKDDNEMMTAKTGNWFYENPQRGRSNNSVVLVRDTTTRAEWAEIFKSVREFGEPGFAFFDDIETLSNPCLAGDSIVETNVGNITIRELVAIIENAIANELELPLVKSFNEKTQLPEFKEAYLGIKTKKNAELLKITFEDGRALKLTPNHKVLTSNRGYVEAEALDINDDIIIGEFDNASYVESIENSGEQYIDSEWTNRTIISNVHGN